ncbi:tetratricopeptide repeat protein 25 [Thrips palmi]|uniref:Outer dynein arm-docking complex subunit 4 n=1 Tax=Thrips palmi TaxID=161013 RepID=A0A6P8Z4C3_THRPL|nr:tetratricopeptide repeat protein 25 [Thrips palmi]
MYGGLGALAAIRKGGAKNRRNRVIRGEEVYTDKDRAAAVQMGHRDIKQSLRMKRHQERVHALQLPEEADGSTLLALGQYELRQGNIDIAIAFVNKALQLCPEDKTALVARSKCYLLLGQPRLALQDAETALEPDRNFVRAIFQKAEALYHMGDFEHSLMYYHRGLRLRPELAVFRLGVQKAQEAIENTIGTGIEESCHIMEEMERSRSGRAGTGRDANTTHGFSTLPTRAVLTIPNFYFTSRYSYSVYTTSQWLLNNTTGIIYVTYTRSRASRSSRSSQSNRHLSHSPSSTDGEEQSARRLLGELCVDKLYLEQLLKHPDIRCARKDRSSQIAEHAEDGVEFLRNRQEFWRQQKLSTGPGGVSVSRSTASTARRKQATPTGNNTASSNSSSARNSARNSRPTTATLQAVA